MGLGLKTPALNIPNQLPKRRPLQDRQGTTNSLINIELQDIKTPRPTPTSQVINLVHGILHLRGNPNIGNGGNHKTTKTQQIKTIPTDKTQ
jgi:hypothetical protein